MICYRVRMDDSSAIILFALNEQDALIKASERRINPNSTAIFAEAL